MSAANGTNGSILFTLVTSEMGNLFGQSVCGLGDADGDGVGDIAVGAPRDDAGAIDGGRVLVYAGGMTGSSVLMTIGSPNAWSSIKLVHLAHPDLPSLVLGDVTPGPVYLHPFLFDLGLTPYLTPLNDSDGLLGPPMGSPIDGQGYTAIGPVIVPPNIVGLTVYLQGFALSPLAPNGYFQQSNPLTITFLP